MKPTLRQFEYAVALADHLHFGRAAASCGVSQPALSTQLKQLEQSLGLPLFERSRRRVLLTPEGSEIVIRARRILRDVADLVEQARPAVEPLTGTLRLGVIPTIAPYLLPRMLPEVREAHPRLQLLLEEDRATELLPRLAGGDLDLLLAALPVAGAGLHSVGLFKEHLVAALPANHPLVAKEMLTPEDLEGEEVLMLADGHCLRDHAREVCGRAAVGEVHGNSLGTLVQMVANGLGITLLPALAVAVEIRPGTSVEARPFERPAPTREIGLVWREGAPREDEFKLLATLLRSVLPRI